MAYTISLCNFLALNFFGIRRSAYLNVGIADCGVCQLSDYESVYAALQNCCQAMQRAYLTQVAAAA